MLIAEDKMKAEFLLKMHEMAQQHFKESLEIWRPQRELLIARAKVSLGTSLELLFEKYNLLHKKGVTQELHYVYLSFLRTSILCHIPWYRLDAYDSRDCISDVECGERWDIPEISSCLYSIVNKIQIEFSRQSRVKEYELDEITYQLAEQYYKECKSMFAEILEKILLDKGEKILGEKRVDFMMGEFLGKTDFILRWEQGKIIFDQVNEKLEEEETML